MSESLNQGSSHSGQECSRIIKFARLALWPRVQLRGVDKNLTVGREFDVRAVHRPRGRAFEVDPFTVVAAAVARTFEFIFAGLPIRCASQVRAARVDHE